MLRLLLLRHGKAEKEQNGISDHDRPLKMRGVINSLRIGKVLVDDGLMPDFIVSSTALRARHTAELVAKQSKFPGTVQFAEHLYHAEPSAYINEAKSALGDGIGSCLMVGHNPGMEELVWSLTGAEVEMPTAGLAVIDIEASSWKDFNLKNKAKLVELYRPSELDSE